MFNNLLKVLFFTVFIISNSYASGNPEQYHLQGKTMGTTYNVKYIQNSIAPDKSMAIQANIDRVLKDVNQKMSIFIPDSEISKFNNLKQTNEFMPISDDFAKVILVAQEIHQLTDGKFDITIGPLVNLWGFGSTQKSGKIPSQEEIAKVKQNVGLNNLLIKKTNNGFAIAKKIPNLFIDLGAIAKGFGVDKVAEYLDSIYINDYLVEIGGDLRTKGKNKNNTIWSVGIEKPQLIDPIYNDLSDKIYLEDLAITTSGSYRNFIKDKNNKVYSHGIDPETGAPIENNLLSVSVIDENAMRSDGFSTGIFVLGEIKGMELAEKINLPVYMIVNSSEGEFIKMSSQFEKFLKK